MRYLEHHYALSIWGENLMNKLLAAILTKKGCPLEIKTLDIPPLLKGQVLVKILYSGVCRSQLMEVRGGRGDDPWIPHMLGHEGSGIVVSVGDGVTKVLPGDNVILGWIKCDGIEAEPAKYFDGKKIINSGLVSTFSNYSIVSESRLVKKPESIAFDIAVLFGCALLTGGGMILNELKPSRNDSVIVLGLGGIGLSSVIALKSIGIKKIIAVDISEKKLELAKKLGATCIVNSSNSKFHRIVNELTNGGADICVESGGHVKTIELGFSLIKKNGGKLLFASHPPDGEKIQLLPHELISGKSISGSWGGASKPDLDIPRMHTLFASKNIPLRSLLTKNYHLNQINEALDDLENGLIFRPLITMNHS